MSKICGVGISSNVATFVILNGSRSDFVIEESKFKKNKLSEEKSQDNIRSFSAAIQDMFRQNDIERVFVKRPSTGMYQAKHPAFKIEALIQLSDVEVKLLPSQTITAFLKKNPGIEELYSKVLKYQSDALQAAYCGLD
jgi:hypothetical protein